MNSLSEIIKKLELHPDVDAVFLTGSHGTKTPKPYSDIDLVIILKENKNSLHSLYRWIDGVFADIFFFDEADLKRISSTENIDWNSPDGYLVGWIQKADIYFDHSGIITSLKKKVIFLQQTEVTKKDKQSYWQKINYNFVANKRYYESNDPLYHEALELRLLYSIIELICGYLALRNIPWRGEKSAIIYLKEQAPLIYSIFKKYTNTVSIEGRFKLYSDMVSTVFTDEYKQWTQSDQIVIKKDYSIADSEDGAVSYSHSLFLQS